MNISEEIGTRLLFENDRVRVWDLALAPGESTGMHRHENDYLYVVIGGGKLQGVSSDGVKREARDMEDGQVQWRDVDGEDVHEAINVGDASLAEYYCGTEGIGSGGPISMVKLRWVKGRGLGCGLTMVCENRDIQSSEIKSGLLTPF